MLSRSEGEEKDLRMREERLFRRSFVGLGDPSGSCDVGVDEAGLGTVSTKGSGVTGGVIDVDEVFRKSADGRRSHHRLVALVRCAVFPSSGAGMGGTDGIKSDDLIGPSATLIEGVWCLRIRCPWSLLLVLGP